MTTRRPAPPLEAPSRTGGLHAAPTQVTPVGGPARGVGLKPYLDALVEQYGTRELLYTDPLCIPHAFEEPLDQEVSAFLAAGLAYGRVDGILRSARSALERMGNRPHAFVRHFEPRRDAARFDGWVHRFNRGEDIAVLSLAFRHIYASFGSLGDYFSQFVAPNDCTLAPALSRFSAAILGLDYSPLVPGGVLPPDSGVRWFFADPADGSACKRANLFLRWMVRRDGLDLGLWALPPARLLMPVDTHVARICRYLGLTRRATVGWSMVEEITAGLRLLDPADPVRYDWAICRLGILQHCPSHRDPDVCASCRLLPVCVA